MRKITIDRGCNDTDKDNIAKIEMAEMTEIGEVNAGGCEILNMLQLMEASCQFQCNINS